MINVLRKTGGYATLRRLNELVDFSTWATKTPEASVRRIVQDSPEIFKIQPGLWFAAISKARREELENIGTFAIYKRKIPDIVKAEDTQTDCFACQEPLPIEELPFLA